MAAFGFGVWKLVLSKGRGCSLADISKQCFGSTWRVRTKKIETNSDFWSHLGVCLQGEQTPVQGFGWGCSGFAAPCTGAGLRAMQSSSFWLCHSAVHFLPCASVYPLKKQAEQGHGDRLQAPEPSWDFCIFMTCRHWAK